MDNIVIGDIHGDYRIIIEILINELNLSHGTLTDNNGNIIGTVRFSNKYIFDENINYIRNLTNDFKAFNKNIKNNIYKVNFYDRENNLFDVSKLTSKIIVIGDIFDVGSVEKEYVYPNKIHKESYKIVNSLLTFAVIKYLKKQLKSKLILIYGNHEVTLLNNYNYLIMRKFIINNFRSFYYEYDRVNKQSYLYTHFKSNYISIHDMVTNNDCFFQTIIKHIYNSYDADLTLVKRLLINQIVLTDEYDEIMNKLNLKLILTTNYNVNIHFVGHCRQPKIKCGKKHKYYNIDCNMSRFKNGDEYNLYVKQIGTENKILHKIKGQFIDYVDIYKDVHVVKKEKVKDTEEINYDINLLFKEDDRKIIMQNNYINIIIYINLIIMIIYKIINKLFF